MKTFLKSSALGRSHRSALPLVLAVMLSLTACQRAGTIQRADGWERLEPFDAAAAVGERDDVDPADGPIANDADAPPAILDSVVQALGLPFAEQAPERTGPSTAGTTEPPHFSGPRGGGEPSAAATPPAGGRLTEWSRDNPTAADLLDNWGHRPFERILSQIPLTPPQPSADHSRLLSLHDAAQSPDTPSPIPIVKDADEFTVLGNHRGITYGRWIAGPADTLAIRFDLSRAGQAVRDHPGFAATLKQAAKAWTYRINDTWTAWERQPGDLKGHISNGNGLWIPVYVGPDGETSTGLEIHVTNTDFPGNQTGYGGFQNRWPANYWQPHFGYLAIDFGHPSHSHQSELFSTLTHEIGHVLGAWMGKAYIRPYAPYTDTATGRWTGPNVVALHGGPAPFQNESDPFTSIDGERDPAATRHDFGHSGVCASIMAYCAWGTPSRAILPAPIDFAFLADLGLNISAATNTPETYGLAGWMDHSAFTFSVSRDLRLDVAYVENSRRSRYPQPVLDITDMLYAEADAFGNLTTASIQTTYPPHTRLGSVRYAGSLIGAAIDRPSTPPVLGNAALSVNLDTLDGKASFTSLSVYSRGTPAPFAGGSLHYPIAIADNAISTTTPDTSLSANFFGPAHQEIAGTLHDQTVSLMASFGATHDTRPSAEKILAGADRLAGLTAAPDASGSPGQTFSQHRCQTAASCETRDDITGEWSDWTAEPRATAVASTSPPNRRTATLIEDRDYLRIEAHFHAVTMGDTQPATPSAYTGTLTHGAFGTGFDEDSTIWAGAYGTSAGSIPDSPAQWSGDMLGYRHDRVQANNSDPFVRGRATLDFHPSTATLDVTFSDVTDLDEQQTLADFAFLNLRPSANGDFEAHTQGIITGSILGPNREEASGAFHHDAAKVTGSFGAQAVSDAITLEDTGTQNLHVYDDWGVWATQFDRELFRAILQQITTEEGMRTYYHFPYETIDGTRSGTNPVSGTATWNGSVHAFDPAEWTTTATRGTALIAVDFSDTTVDVNFTDFDSGAADMAWQDMQLSAGRFHDTAQNPTIEGSFYGTHHQGVAGTFDRNQLRGIFGAVRADTP